MMELFMGIVTVALILLGLLVIIYVGLMIYKELKEEIEIIRREKENERTD